MINKGLNKYIVAIVCSLIVAFITGEATIRLFGLSKTWNGKKNEKLHKEIIAKHYSKDKIGYRYLASSNFISLRDKTYTINKDGFRDIEFKKKKTNLRIAVLGDSVIEGLGIDVKDRATNKAKKSLSLTTKKEIDIYNFGIGAYSTFDELYILENTVVKFNADYTLLQICYNDLLRNYHYSINQNITLTNKDSSSLKIKNLLRKYSAFYLFLAEQYNYHLLVNGVVGPMLTDVIKKKEQEWILLNELIKKFGNICKDSKSIPVVMYIPYEAEVTVGIENIGTMVTNRIDSICNQLHMESINVTNDLRLHANPNDLYLDHCHLSEMGHEIVAKCMTDYFTNVFEDLPIRK